MRKDSKNDMFNIIIEPYDDEMPKTKQYIQLNPLMPNNNFRMMIIGGSGCGKTTLLTNLLMKYIHFDKLYVYAKTIGDPRDKYILIENFIKDCEAKVEDKSAVSINIGEFSNDLSDLVQIDDLDQNKQNLIVFDDVVLEKDQGLIKEHMIRGRKKNCSYVYLTQSYYQVPKLIRLQMSHFIIFNIDNKRELQEIAKVHATRLDHHKFLKLYQECVNEEYNFMYIDTFAKDLCMYLRSGFDGLLVDY